MKKTVSSLLLLISIITLTVFTSCDDDEPYYGPGSGIEGRWAVVEVNGAPVNNFDYVFYGSGKGQIDYNPETSAHYSVPFTWYMDYNPAGAEYLHMQTYDGEYYNYIVRVESEYVPGYNGVQWVMNLTDTDTGDNLMFIEY